MKTDADTVIDRIGALIPDVKVVRMHKTHPADDDGLWWFKLPETDRDIQIESSSYNLPFLVEHSDMIASTEAITTTTIEETVKAILDYLNHLRQEAEDATSNGGNAPV